MSEFEEYGDGYADYGIDDGSADADYEPAALAAQEAAEQTAAAYEGAYRAQQEQLAGLAQHIAQSNAANSLAQEAKKLARTSDPHHSEQWWDKNEAAVAAHLDGPRAVARRGAL